MDIATIIGLVGGVAAIIMSVITSGGSLMGIIDIPSVFMTIGGSFCAILIVSPMKDVLHTFKVLGKVFKIPDFGEKVLVQNMVALSEKARREGILALEEGLEDLEDEFMKTGLRLVVDGTDGAVIRTILESEMDQVEARHMVYINVMTQWAGYAPGFGMIGTVLGLIGMLKNLEDKSSLGPNMAVALVTTLYGSLLANWIIGPMAQKLINQNSQEMRIKEMIIEGVLSIQAGDNPRILALKLLTYLDPKSRKAIEADVLKD
ncbi:MAG: motility protein A [Candidatus Treponema excrementipullorum]|nr:motility protein A [Spirochaetia bacterium]MDY2755172.1 motility protein A [Candidatus Treponema excrementipullorum]MCI6954200.1 motility protein A [Spirochaetia bacterium]MCI7588266.1 motility protein A [Spirochaetia bacterium]MDY4465058.1 motility protein A [Candidatus Treponema excrementipullorum]